MRAPELPPFDYQLVKDRATKEPATGAGELSGYGIIACKGGCTVSLLGNGTGE